MWDWIKKLNELQLSGAEAAIVTVVKCAGSTPRNIGAKMLVLPDKTFFGSIGGGKLEELALQEAMGCLQSGTVKTSLYPLCIKTGQCCGGSMEVLIELINTGPKLYLFGAGHVGKAVCQTLSGTPFRVELVDERPEWINSPDLPSEVIKHQCSWQNFLRTAKWQNESIYAAVMTHSHLMDEEIIHELVTKPARYIGLIGSKTKWQRFSSRLEKKGVSKEQLDRVTCPIGTTLAGKAPKEVAISFASQLLATHYAQ